MRTASAKGWNEPTTFWGATRRTFFKGDSMSWILTNRKTGKSRTFKSLTTGKAAAIKAAAKYGVRYVSLRPQA